ncbi:MAG TPA: MBL fold metallo-hydrolase [Polyangia bacterium]|jgi:glyoxylase-like metal-dependent hydrolase (beta-lactamase superfamily II)|nr:MBL fold metallo-hydrolase [Polyangia bacterium]
MALVFEQLFDAESSTYTYLVGDDAAKVGALIDPVVEQVERDLARVAAHGLSLVHTIETHVHADHVTGGAALTERTGSTPVVHRQSPVECEAVRLGQGDRLRLGALVLEVLETPGHTPESLSFVLLSNEVARVFSGDALLIGSCGRTDFQGGDAGALYDAIHARLFTLPDATMVYPAHDYKGRTSSTIGEEKRGNARIAGKTRDEFIALMNGLGLPPPKKIDVALEANLACGRPRQAH